VAAIVEGLEGALADAWLPAALPAHHCVWAVLEATFSSEVRHLPCELRADFERSGALIGTELDGPLEFCGAPVS